MDVVTPLDGKGAAVTGRQVAYAEFRAAHPDHPGGSTSLPHRS